MSDIIDTGSKGKYYKHLGAVLDLALSIRRTSIDPAIHTLADQIATNTNLALAQDIEDERVSLIQAKGAELIKIISSSGHSEDISTAIHRVKEAVMWATRHHRG